MQNGASFYTNNFLREAVTKMCNAILMVYILLQLLGVDALHNKTRAALPFYDWLFAY